MVKVKGLPAAVFLFGKQCPRVILPCSHTGMVKVDGQVQGPFCCMMGEWCNGTNLKLDGNCLFYMPLIYHIFIHYLCCKMLYLSQYVMSRELILISLLYISSVLTETHDAVTKCYFLHLVSHIPISSYDLS